MPKPESPSPPDSAKPTPATNGRSARKHSPEDAANLDAIAGRMSAVFGDVVSIMMNSRQHRYAFLNDLEWMVLPALATGQFAIVEGRHKDSQLTTPRAVILWGKRIQ